MEDPEDELDFSALSIKSGHSMDPYIDFRDKDPALHHRRKMENPMTGPRGLSMRSDCSMNKYINFKDGDPAGHSREGHTPGGKRGQSSQLDAISTEKIISFVKDERRHFNKVLACDYPECLVSEEDKGQNSRQAYLKIPLDFLKKMKQEQLADHLHKRSNFGVCHHKLKNLLQQRFSHVFEGTTKAGNPTLLNQIYTELYITEGGAAGVNEQHEVRYIKKSSREPAIPETTINCEDIFKGPAQRQGPIRTELTRVSTRLQPLRKELLNRKRAIREVLSEGQGPIRTVLTKGVAGIGKTVLTQKFILDWAEGQANQDIQLLFPFTFRELNVLRDTQFSLVGLLHHFFSESAGLCSIEHLQVVFIFDGLDECRLPLDFTKTRVLTETTESVSVDVLLVNLIRGNLLPSACLWITTRPTAAKQIPAECVSMVTEVRGFTDPQKEQYFRKRFRDEQQATAIISHIRTSHSLHNMCDIPVFCWILSTVLKHVMETGATDQLPQTMTEVYIHFLVVQAKVKSLKYNGSSEMDPLWTSETRKMVESLGKLAFEQLQKGNLIFCESDLRECGLDPTAASVYSGVFTLAFREETGLHQDKVYCFVHLSVQEFLAALYVYLTFINSGVNLLSCEKTVTFMKRIFNGNPQLTQLHQSAVDQALQSPNGHQDLFLHFLLGLSMPSNQNLLQGLLTQTGSSSQNTKKTVAGKISEDLPVERIIAYH